MGWAGVGGAGLGGGGVGWGGVGGGGVGGAETEEVKVVVQSSSGMGWCEQRGVEQTKVRLSSKDGTGRTRRRLERD